MSEVKINHMEYMEGMEPIPSAIMEQVTDAMNRYDYSRYTAADVLAALNHDTRAPRDFAALLSPAAEPYLEQMAQAAQTETRR